jgi:hypothetical protein
MAQPINPRGFRHQTRKPDVKDASATPWDPAQNWLFRNQNYETASGSVDHYGLVFSVPAGQQVPFGGYSDVVTFELTY